ncbi:chondrolectin isoform X2 [Leucoraja erinacea]|uniref:chondrolectin isoform X2 n=1 Tax=Leucoraja erinaceus TaxID=7782 RepID=UPI002457BCD2|nr:chondrolectin isoform X2 [Leucoraja erinacea]
MLAARELSSTMLVLNMILSGIFGSSSGTRVLSGQTICYGGSDRPCYKIAYFQDLSRRIGFVEASQACEMDRGALLSIRSLEEQKLIETLLQDLTRSGTGLSDGDFWIGLRRGGEAPTHNAVSGCPDRYKWTDGSPATFRNWYVDEPSCGSEACVVMYHQLTAQPGLGGPYLYQWNDDRCNMKHNFICKYEPGNTLTNELVDSTDLTFENVSTSPEVKVHAPSNSGDGQRVVVTESSGIMPNVVYVVIPTIPLLLLLVVAMATCCIQMLNRSKDRSKTSPNESTLWISPAPKKENLADV